MEAFLFGSGIALWLVVACFVAFVLVAVAVEAVIAVTFAIDVVRVVEWKPDLSRTRKARAFARIAWSLFVRPCDRVTGANGTAFRPGYKPLPDEID